MMSYDCVDGYSAYIDTVGSSLGTYSDFLANLHAPENMSMLGWGKNYPKKRNN
jgi:hypothetical protein